MHLVVAHNWSQSDEAVAVVAAATGQVVFEARQKMVGGGPVVLSSFSEPDPAAAAVATLLQGGVPALVLDTQEVRRRIQTYEVVSFDLETNGVRVTSREEEPFRVDADAIDLLLVGTSSAGAVKTNVTETKRQLSIGKTLLAGGMPMSKKVKTQTTLTSEEQDQVLWLYTREGKVLIFLRQHLDYNGLGAAMQLSRELNFSQLLKRLRQLAPKAVYDDRLLRKANQRRLLGPLLSPVSDLDLACEILARTLRSNS